MIDLINRDRASVGAPPVEIDDVANKAGQLHSDEMAAFGYLSHWTMDGRKPDQRYTECGGKDTVAENVDATIVNTPQKLPLRIKQCFKKRELEEIESQFFNEKPPNDGHRVNIIDPRHTAVGIGLSAAGGETGEYDDYSRTACTQEFINHYGTYGDIPLTIAPGEPLVLDGTLAKGLHFQSIDLRFEKLPEPMTIAQLDKTYSYSIPDEELFSYFPPPYQSPAPVTLTSEAGCEHFSLQIQTSKQWRQGLYYVCLWATIANDKDPVLVSTRTFKFGSGSVSVSDSPLTGKNPPINSYRLKRPHE
jgi:hypothetical protein